MRTTKTWRRILRIFPHLFVLLLLYQAVCFPIYGIPQAKSSESLVFDRTDLPCLNIIEKFNCFYCSYTNGLAAYLREIAARTEQDWCPIEHVRRIKAAHNRYPRFFEYGDAESFSKGLERLRKEYDKGSREGATSGLAGVGGRGEKTKAADWSPLFLSLDAAELPAVPPQ